MFATSFRRPQRHGDPGYPIQDPSADRQQHDAGHQHGHLVRCPQQAHTHYQGRCAGRRVGGFKEEQDRACQGHRESTRADTGERDAFGQDARMVEQPDERLTEATARFSPPARLFPTSLAPYFALGQRHGRGDVSQVRESLREIAKRFLLCRIVLL